VNYNILNGGLIVKVNNQLYLTNKNSLDTNFGCEGIPWFMNNDSNDIFYSDQKQNNGLYKWNIELQSESLILDKPCYGLILHNESLYYIDENNEQLYCYPKNGKKETKVVVEEINNFIIDNDYIYYATPEYIKRCDLSGRNIEKLYDGSAAMMVLIDEKLAFADKKNQNILTILDLNTLTLETITDISVSFINTDGQYLFCANSQNNNNIFRVNPQDGKSIRMCSEHTTHLHIIDGDLLFCVNNEWHKMSLFGGEAIKIRGTRI